MRPAPTTTATICLSGSMLDFSVVALDGSTTTASVPCGTAELQRRHFAHDPPHPEELTNAIGDVLDHLEDVLRELPHLAGADAIRLVGSGPGIIAAVEHGGPIAANEFALSRDAAEDVFRTLATESAHDRSRNPGLPAADVATIVASCCVVVAILRGLQLTEVVVDLVGDGSLG